MIELIIPQAGEETKNAKDLVFSILTEHKGLSLIEIVNIIHKQYNVSLTYQAVKKAADNLTKKKVLNKDGKYFSLNKKWLIDLKSRIDLLASDKGIATGVFSAKMAKEDYALYKFSNLLDADNFWDDMLIYLADNLKKDEPKEFISRTHFSWWMLINLGKETKLFQYFHEKKIESLNINVCNYPLNKWAGTIYKDIGGYFKLGNLKKTVMSDTINVIGNTIIQVKYPKTINERLHKFYSKYNNVQEMSLKEITELVHKPCEVKFIVFKNKELADSYRDKYSKYMK